MQQQQAAGAAICPLCRGKKTVQTKAGPVTCPRCAGSGRAGYPVK